MTEFGPLFTYVSRVVAKNSDGSPTLKKTFRLSIEELDTEINQWVKQFNEKRDTMYTVLQYTTSPVDPFKIKVPADFLRVEKSLNSVVEVRDQAKTDYANLLSWFNVAKYIQSSDFFLLWDDLFVPEACILRKPEKFQKSHLIPVFCKQACLTRDHMMLLWGWQNPNESLVSKSRQKTARKKRRNRTSLKDVVSRVRTVLALKKRHTE